MELKLDSLGSVAQRMALAATCPKCKTCNTFAGYNVPTTCKDCGLHLIHPHYEAPERDCVPTFEDIYPEPDPEPPE